MDLPVLRTPAGTDAPARLARPKEDRHFVTALARGLDVLACFRSGETTLGNQEIAQRCGLPKSTVSRLTATLTRLGYLVLLEDSGRYRLGTATLALGSAMLARLDVRQVARPLMQALAAFSGAMVSLGARDRLAMIYVENCRSTAALTLSLDVGSRIPVASTAMGRAWVAAAAPAERRALLEQLQAADPHAWPAVYAGIERAMDDVRQLGVACSFGDWQQDVHAIARAFDPGGGLPPMSINCGGPAFQLPRRFLLDEVRPRLIDAVAQLEGRLAR